MARNGLPDDEQAAIIRGKSPRNALIAIGAFVALIIGAIGFYYQVKASDEADEEARLQKAAKTAAVVDKSADHSDVDKIIADQQAAARRIAASEARPASAPAGHDKPGLSADGFSGERDTSELAASTKADNVFTSPIFPAGVKVKDQPATQLPQGLAGLPTPQQIALQQAAAQQAAAAQAAALASGLAQSGAPAPAPIATSQDRDMRFLKAAANANAEGDFPSTGFVGQSHGCTLSPPHHIPVLAIEGLNSDRAGTASLLVYEDVYDSIRGDCLMIPKGSTIVAPYSSDIQPGQERTLVAATELRLPNGKHVPLYGAQGADADGTSGFSGDVNNHFIQIYGTSFLTAILLRRFDGGDATTTSGPLGVTQVGSTAGQVAATTSQSVLSRYQNIPPTITDEPGKQRFMVKVNRDIHLEPYRE